MKKNRWYLEMPSKILKGFVQLNKKYWKNSLFKYHNFMKSAASKSF